MSTLVRVEDAPSEVRDFDSEKIEKVRAAILAGAAQLPPGGEFVVEIKPLDADPKEVAESALVHHALELIRQKHPRYTIRYGGHRKDGSFTATLLRTSDASARSVANEMGNLKSAGYLVAGGE